MTKSAFSSVDEYLAAQPALVQRILAHVRSTIREALPATQELVTYNMPTYKLNGKRLLSFAA